MSKSDSSLGTQYAKKKSPRPSAWFCSLFTVRSGSRYHPGKPDHPHLPSEADRKTSFCIPPFLMIFLYDTAPPQRLQDALFTFLINFIYTFCAFCHSLCQSIQISNILWLFPGKGTRSLYIFSLATPILLCYNSLKHD